MKVVLLEGLGVRDEKLNGYSDKLKSMGHEFQAFPKDTDVNVQIERAKDADVIMIANMPLKGEVISACPNLKFINIAFTGVDHVDIEVCREKGVKVSNASGYSTESVAELTVGCALSLLRNVPQVEKRVREGGTKDGLVGFELKGKTIGIVGVGAIGGRSAELFHAFGCKILGNKRHVTGNEPSYIEFVSLDELLKASDIVALHCPLTDETKGLINEERISLMKKSAFLINMARGPVVDSNALADALNKDGIAGAAVDVFETEPPLDTNHPLLHSKNTIATPHIAFASKESMELRCDIVFDSLFKWMDGNQVNVIL